MFVYINTLPAHSKTGGIKTFLIELVSSLLELNTNNIHYILLCSSDNYDLFSKFETFDNVTIKIVYHGNISPLKRIFFEQFFLKKFIDSNTKCILLNICNVKSFLVNIPQITIVQGPLSVKKLRNSLEKKHINVSLFHRIYYDLLLTPSLKYSNRVIAVSEYIASYISQYNNVSVIHEGVNLNHFSVPNFESSISLPTKKNYILSISTLFPYKNMDLVIKYFHEFLRNYSLDYDLIIIGKDPDNKQRQILKSLISKFNLNDRVHLLGFVTYRDIPFYYKRASLFIYLSSVETFGLPVLEAMASNVPVIASNCMSIPEVVGDGGIIVDPFNQKEVVDSMFNVLTNVVLNENLKLNGKNNIIKFNWNFTAIKFESVFLKLWSDTYS